MNYIFTVIMLASLIVSIFCNTPQEVMDAGINGAKNAVEFIISVGGMICMWSGILEIAKEGGLLKTVNKIIYPIMKLLFPKLDKNSESLEHITANVSANLLGVGNAATPAGIKAMELFDKINKTPDTANEEMGIFTVMNTASIQLIPTTIISMRSAYGSVNSQKVIIPILVSSFCALFCAIFAMKVINRIKWGNNRQ